MKDTRRSVSDLIRQRVDQAPGRVWTPSDFVHFGGRDSVDKALQRLTKAGKLRRIDRGLYDVPRHNALTGKPMVPDYREVIDAVARRDKVRMVVDGMTAANALGMTNAVPAKIEVLADARLKPINLGKLKITFRLSAPSRLYWAGRPGMYLVQALHWIHDVMYRDAERERVLKIIRALLRDDETGPELTADLESGLSAMQEAALLSAPFRATCRALSTSDEHSTP